MSDLVTLNYDTLPAESKVRRETDERGNLRISVAAGEPGLLARRASLFVTAWTSIVWSGVIFCVLILLSWPMYVFNRPRSPAMDFIMMMSAGVFFSAMFLLIWWLEHRKRVDALERAALQMTVVSASRREVLIESVGPYGEISKSVRPPLHLRIRRTRNIECIQLVEPNGEASDLFPGLSVEELHWIASELQRATTPRP